MKRVILFGAPGAGKGTQADAIEEKYGYKKISTGDLIRAEVAAQSKVGLKVKSIIDKGELVSDQVILELLESRLGQGDITDGYIMDGFPRTRSQAEALSRMPVDSEVVIYLNVFNEDVVVERLLSRLTCSSCGAIFNILNTPPRVEGKCDLCNGDLVRRADDNEETIRNRISVYREQTGPAIDYYREKASFHELDATRAVDTIFVEITGVLN